mgnify:CR=1 FL=1
MVKQLWANVRWATFLKSLVMRLSNQKSIQGQTVFPRNIIGLLNRYIKMQWEGRISRTPSQISWDRKHRLIKIRLKSVLPRTNLFTRSLIQTLPMNLWTLDCWSMKMTLQLRKWWTVPRCLGCSSLWVLSNPTVLTRTKRCLPISGDKLGEMKREGTQFPFNSSKYSCVLFSTSILIGL